MTSITAPGSAAGRRGLAALVMAFVLLGTYCEKKAAPLRRQAALSTFNDGSAGGSRPESSFGSATAILGGGGGEEKFNLAPASVSVPLAAAGQSGSFDTRKIIRNGSLDLLVNDVSQSIDKIGSIVTGVGGFVEKSTQTNSGGHSAMTVRVPPARLDQVTSELKGPATNVDRE